MFQGSGIRGDEFGETQNCWRADYNKVHNTGHFIYDDIKCRTQIPRVLRISVKLELLTQDVPPNIDIEVYIPFKYALPREKLLVVENYSSYFTRNIARSVSTYSQKCLKDNRKLYCFILCKKNRGELLRDMYLGIYGNSYRRCDNL